jgi:hypothetical protein
MGGNKFEFVFPNVKKVDQQSMRRIIIPMMQDTLKQFGGRLS